MIERSLPVLLAALAVSAAAATLPAQDVQWQPSGTLSAFRSDAELSSYLHDFLAERRRVLAAREARVLERMGCKVTARVAQRGSAAAQSGAVIGGHVRDGSGGAVSGVSVRVEGMRLGATSGGDGAYRIVVPAESLSTPRRATVVTRAIGRRPLEHSLELRRADSVTIDFAICSQPLTLSLAAVAAPSVSRSGVGTVSDESITNVQHAGVDEGGIVKLHGDHLVVLRRGRLFTIAVGDGELKPVAAVDAFGPGLDPRHAWYDELLISGDRIVVVGYSYERGGTELGVFQIDGRGALRHLGTYQLRSNDYYSSRNYASRLVGTKLLFYAPLYLRSDHDEPGETSLDDVLPSLRKWDDGAGKFRRIASASHVYRPAWALDPAAGDAAIHTVTSCDIATPELSCEATALIGPSGRVFYVSPRAVYVWTTEWRMREDAEIAVERVRSTAFRLPLDGSAPSALGVWGSPVDQFSFLESEDGALNVLVRAEARGDAMWLAEKTEGATALLRVPVARFGDGREAAEAWRYRALPALREYTIQNRFVGDRLLYGAGSSWGAPRKGGSPLHVVPLEGGAIATLRLPHGVDRIEAMGADALVVGTDGADLRFSGIRLDGRPTVRQRFTLANAAQGELRSQGFFYKADGPGSGLLGLPVRGSGEPGYKHLIEGSASILFLRNADGRFDALGQLAARGSRESNEAGTGDADDGCVASCMDWYGNARPLFFRGRVIALLGYELVEGRVERDGIHEMRRASFAPPAVKAVKRE